MGADKTDTDEMEPDGRRCGEKVEGLLVAGLESECDGNGAAERI